MLSATAKLASYKHTIVPRSKKIKYLIKKKGPTDLHIQ